MIKGYLKVIVFFTFYSCNKLDIEIPQLDRKPVLYALGINGQHVSASLSWTGAIANGAQLEIIEDAKLFLRENGIIVDTFKISDNLIYNLSLIHI